MMHCPDCAWHWDWDDDPAPHCPYCGSVGEATNDDPPAAHHAVAQVSGAVFGGNDAAMAN